MSERTGYRDGQEEGELGRELEASLRRASRDSLAPAALVIGLVYAFLIPSHVFFVALPARWPLVASALASLLFCIGAWRRWRGSPPALERADALLALLAGVVFSNGALHVALTGEPRQTTNLALLALGAGLLFLSRGWLLLVLGTTLCAWVLIAALAPPSPEWSHFGFLLVGACTLAIVTHVVRRGAHLRLERERLQSERERARVARELERLASELRRRNVELERRNRELDDFAHVASHDLQQPLRTLASYSELLRKDLGPTLPEPAAMDLALIEAAARRLHVLVQDLLRLSRAGSAALRPERVRVDDVVDQALELLAVAVQESGARLIRDPLPELETDPTLLLAIFQNLIGNALKFAGGQAPVVHVTAEQVEGEWVLGVRDEGIGIPPESREEIFKPFRRLGVAGAEGSGIGLTICRRAVERCGGRIWVESEPGRGTHFRFVLGAPGEQVAEREA